MTVTLSSQIMTLLRRHKIKAYVNRSGKVHFGIHHFPSVDKPGMEVRVWDDGSITLNPEMKKPTFRKVLTLLEMYGINYSWKNCSMTSAIEIFTPISEERWDKIKRYPVKEAQKRFNKEYRNNKDYLFIQDMN